MGFRVKPKGTQSRFPNFGVPSWPLELPLLLPHCSVEGTLSKIEQAAGSCMTSMSDHA